MSLRLGTQYLVVGSSPSISIGWTSECNNGWRYLRTLCRTELFLWQSIGVSSLFEGEKVMEFVEFLRSKEGQVVNSGELVFATVLNMLSNVLISKDMVNLEKETKDSAMESLIWEIMEVAAAPNISDFYPIFGNLDLQGLRKKSIHVVTKFYSKWEPILEERRNSRDNGSSSQQDFVGTLLDNGFTNDRIHQLFMDIVYDKLPFNPVEELLAAGSDTSTSTIECVMTELIKNVESMKKVQDELEIELSESDCPKESQLLQMSYVQACVKETLRLHLPAPLMLPHRAITRDPLIWEEPEMFRPQRFLSSDMDFKGNDFEFLPFGAGRRIFLSSLVHFFDWELAHGKCPADLDMTEKFGAVLQKKEPVLLIPKARK
ncbi:unnamed protein product [Withania somnifera]